MRTGKISIILAAALMMTVLWAGCAYATDYNALWQRDSCLNVDMPREVYEAAYNMLIAHAGDAPSAAPRMYDFGAGYTGVQGEYMARLLNRLLGTTDVFVVCDQAGYSAYSLTSSGYVDNDTRNYHTYGSGSGKRGLKIGYCCNTDPAAVAEKIRVLRSTAETIAGSASGSTSSIVRSFNDSICARCDYDKRKDGMVNSEIASAYGCLINGLAVCDGYADAMTLLCYFKDIPCYSVGCLRDGNKHSMNAIYADGRCMWSDSTYADGGRRNSVLYQEVSEEPFKTFLDYRPQQAARWEKSGKDWVYLDASGRRMTGWIQDDGYWYFLDEGGNMATGRLSDAGAEYFLNDGFTDSIPLGAMCTQMILPDGTTAGPDGRIGE